MLTQTGVRRGILARLLPICAAAACLDLLSLAAMEVRRYDVAERARHGQRTHPARLRDPNAQKARSLWCLLLHPGRWEGRAGSPASQDAG